MSFDVSQLPAHVAKHNNGKDFAKKVVPGAKTAKLLMDQRAVLLGKGDVQIPVLDVDANIQDGSIPGRNASGGVVFSEKILKIARFKDQQNLRSDDLYQAYTIEMLAKGQDPEGETLDADVLNAIIDRRAAKIGAKFEQILWNGDKAGATAPMNLVDGIFKQLATGTYPVVVDAGATTITDKLVSAYTQVPDEISSDESFRIFMSEGTHKKYKAELFKANYFQAVDDMTLAGFSAKIEVLPGMNGSNKVVMGKLSDMKLGTDNESDITNCSIKWSIETEQWYLDFNFAGGIKVVFPEQFVVVTV